MRKESGPAPEPFPSTAPPGPGVTSPSLGVGVLLSGLGPFRGAALEALNPSSSVDQLLLAGIEGVARRADLHVKVRLHRPRVELVYAGAVHVCEHILGMDRRLHRQPSLATRPSLPAASGAQPL